MGVGQPVEIDSGRAFAADAEDDGKDGEKQGEACECLHGGVP